MPQWTAETIAYHERMPERIRRYLNRRGIPDTTIRRFMPGWNGRSITIPVHDRHGRFAYFRLAKDPDGPVSQPKMRSPAGSRAELYGWERVREQPKEITLCEGEFDRLVLEAQGFAAATSTGGAGTFPADWAAYFEDTPEVFICFDRDEAGRDGAQRVARLIPHARVVHLPEEVGDGGDVTDFFVKLRRTPKDFRRLLDQAKPLPPEETRAKRTSGQPGVPVSGSAEAAGVKDRTSLEWLAGQYLDLRPCGRNLVARCPFHDDRTPSFVVFRRTNTFHCFGCKATGDCFSFLMRMEGLTFPESLEVLKRLAAV